MRHYNYLFMLLSLFFCVINTEKLYSQEKLSIEPGIHVNTMLFLSDYPTGLGVKLDLNYKPIKNSFVIVAMRTKFTYYNFNNNSSITKNSEGIINSYNKNPNLTYTMILPQIGLVPKLFYKVDDDIAFFIENDFSVAYAKGNIKYIDKSNVTKKNVGKLKFIYSPSIGVAFKINSTKVFASVGYTFLNFRSIIEENKPINYNDYIPTQDTGILFNISCNIPILK